MLSHFGWLFHLLILQRPQIYSDALTLHCSKRGFDPADYESVFREEFLHIGSVIHSVRYSTLTGSEASPQHLTHLLSR